MLVETVREAAVRDQALDLRLYVHQGNERAIKAYRKAGFIDADYRIMRMDVPAGSDRA
jgi:ribosomal protein S18 acetylase RimI-like enzyme